MLDRVEEEPFRLPEADRVEPFPAVFPLAAAVFLVEADFAEDLPDEVFLAADEVLAAVELPVDVLEGVEVCDADARRAVDVRFVFAPRLFRVPAAFVIALSRAFPGLFV